MLSITHQFGQLSMVPRIREAKASGLSKVAIAGAVSFDLDRVGLSKDVSLTDALVALSDEVEHVIVLIIDEAQHALTADAGIAALFALKAARDELNSTHHHGVRIACTGSNRDKLAMLRNSKDRAFYGAPMVLRVMPATGSDYAPFEAVAMELYRKGLRLVGIAENEVKVDVPGVQQALIALQDKKLIWRAARGVYAIEEQSIADILAADGLLTDLTPATA